MRAHLDQGNPGESRVDDRPDVALRFGETLLPSDLALKTEVRHKQTAEPSGLLLNGWMSDCVELSEAVLQQTGLSARQDLELPERSGDVFP